MAVTGIVELATSNVRFGEGSICDIGMDLADMGARHVFLAADPNLVDFYPVQTARESLERNGISCRLYDRIGIEPTSDSFLDAIRTAQSETFDAFVAVGGGSTIDTAKAANLYARYPADFLDYVNPPIGRGVPVPGPLKPLIAVPATTGTGSETTGVSVFDRVEAKSKSVIAHRFLRPTLAILDPLVTRTLPGEVVANTGLDVLSHAIESYTAVPYAERPLPDRPSERPSYQGSNPISDVWALESLHLVRKYLARAVANPDDREARGQMLLAATFAGLGFGNAGVHLPHAMSYPVSGRVKDYHPTGYKTARPLVPHGMSVILTDPAVFRFTAPACPERHLKAAKALAADVSSYGSGDAGKILTDVIAGYMQRLQMPNGLGALGYSVDEIPAMVQGTLPQKRIVDIAPRPVHAEDLARIFEESMKIY